MSKQGDAVSLTINGTRFAIPKDVEPMVIKGGETISETQGFGDGTADAYTSIVIPKITGLRVKLDDSNRDAFEENRRKTDIPFVLQCVHKSYECTGCIVGEVEMSATRNLTGEFEINVTDGSGIRES